MVIFIFQVFVKKYEKQINFQVANNSDSDSVSVLRTSYVLRPSLSVELLFAISVRHHHQLWFKGA